MQNDNCIVGDNVELCSLNSKNRDEYLKVFKIAFNFAELFSTSEELWRTMSGMIRTDSDRIVRFAIKNSNDKRSCGYINYEFEKDMPSIDIAIESKYRNNGYGYEVAKLLCEYLLSQKKLMLFCGTLCLKMQRQFELLKSLVENKSMGKVL